MHNGEIKKPGYDAPAERDPVKNDMICSISMVDGNEVAKWFHRRNHVFTVTTKPDGTIKYEAAA